MRRNNFLFLYRHQVVLQLTRGSLEQGRREPVEVRRKITLGTAEPADPTPLQEYRIGLLASSLSNVWIGEFLVSENEMQRISANISRSLG
jgi:hypothetical protein